MQRLTLTLFFLILTISAVSAQEADNPEKLIVNVSIMPPCVIQSGDDFTGFDIELWQIIAERLKLDYEFKEIEFKDIFDNLINGDVDVAVAGITIKEKREKIVDFSHPYLKSGLRILVPGIAKKAGIINTVFDSLFNFEMLKALGLLALSLLICGFILWWGEKGEDAIHDNIGKGLLQGIWCSWATMTTIGYGDIAPRRIIGRLMTLPIFFIGCIIVGVVTAQITSAMTVNKLEVAGSAIKSSEDLQGRTVATLKGSTSEDILEDIGAQVEPVNRIEQAYEKLLAREVEAVVYDSPAILYYASNEGAGKVAVVGEMFDLQDYGIAFSQNSPLREQVNLVLLGLQENGAYNKIYNKWFGVQ